MSDIEATVTQTETPSTDPVSSFSFDSLHEKAMNFGSDTPPATPAEQVATPEAQVANPAESAPNVDNASAAQLAQLDDNQLVEVTVDGELVQLPWKDAKAGVMRQAHYTKSMQQLRAEQQAFEQNRTTLTKAQQERETLVNLLQNKEMVREFIARQYPDLLGQAAQIAQAQTQVDPNDIATVGQLHELQQQAQQNINQLMQGFQQHVEQQLSQVTQTIEDRAAVAKLSENINGTISEIFKTHPYLQKVIPNAEQVLRYEVLKLAPSTPEETLAAFKQVAEGWVETFNAEVTAKTKASAIEKQKLTTNNIQPPGGAQVQPTPTNFKKTNPMTGKTEVDWDALRNAAMNFGK